MHSLLSATFMNRGAHGNSSLILTALAVLSGKPPLQKPKTLSGGSMSLCKYWERGRFALSFFFPKCI